MPDTAALSGKFSMSQTQNLITTLPAIHVKDVRISLRSRFFTKLLKWTLKPIMKWFVKGSKKRISKAHVFIASTPYKNKLGLEQHYRIVNGVPGPTVGDFLNTEGRVVLWLHGGAFVIPASEPAHLKLLASLSKDLGASGFLPDYRIAPYNQFPHSLDDCERAYLGLLEAGYDASKILLGGDSAGGNLALGALQRIRKAGAPLPGCVTLLSPVAEMGRIHVPPSRSRAARRDPMLPIECLGGLDDIYTRDWDASDPELSPMYADYSGMPPLHFIVGDTEVLRDDSVFCAQRARDAGVHTQLDVWPVLPHAFPLFTALFPETRIAHQDMIQFADQHLA